MAAPSSQVGLQSPGARPPSAPSETRPLRQSAAMTLHRRTCLALVLLLCIACVPARSAALDDRFQQAVNYIFTGRPDPVDGPQILDRKSCVVLVPEPKFNR